MLRNSSDIKSNLRNRSRNQKPEIGRIRTDDLIDSSVIDPLFNFLMGFTNNVCIVLLKGFTYCGDCGNLACCGGSARLLGFSKPITHLGKL